MAAVANGSRFLILSLYSTRFIHVLMETKRRNKTAVNVTPAQRVSDVGKEQFCVEGGVLWFKVYDVPVDHVQSSNRR